MDNARSAACRHRWRPHASFRERTDPVIMHLRGRMIARTLLLSLIATPLLAHTQSPDSTARTPLYSTLDTVRITATRIGSSLLRAGRTVQVLDQRTLQRTASPELSEVLRTNTLVDVRQRGPFDVQTDIGLRGGTFDQALVLLDGIPLSDPQTGHHAMNLPVDVNALQRVEVLHGGASRTYGAGAFSGAVNLITRDPIGQRGSLRVEGGSYGSYRIGVAQEVGGAHGGLRVNAGYSHSDGYIPNSDFDQANLHLSGVRSMKRITLRGQLGAAHKRFGAQNFYSSRFPDQQEIIGMLIGAVEVRNASSPWPWTLRAYHRHHDDRFQLFRESDGYYRYSEGFFIRSEADTARFGPSFFYTFHNRHRTNVSGAEATVKRAWKGGTTAAGVHARDERIQSNVLGELLPGPRTVGNAREPFTRADERQNLAVHLDHRVERGRLGVDAGVLLNINSAFTPEWIPGADIHFRWNARHHTYANASRAFRLPTWTDLYYNRGGAQGSLSLRPEHADQLELGHRMSFPRWSATLALWRRAGRELIDWVQLPGESTVRASNLTQVDLNGMEAMFRYRSSNDRTDLGAGIAYQWADQTGFAFTSLYVLDHVRTLVNVWGQQTVKEHWHLRLNVSWRERNGDYVRFPDGAEVELPAPLRLDLRVDRTLGRVELFATVNNITDAAQMDRGNVPLPGRWVMAGITVNWGKDRE
jgi:vitamin B12 transporter